MSLRLALVIAAIALTALPAAARADDGMRCGNVLVFAGDHEADVLRKCGSPTQAETKKVHYRHLRATIDTWTHGQGPARFVHVLTFTDDVLTEIATGEHGPRRRAPPCPRDHVAPRCRARSRAARRGD